MSKGSFTQLEIKPDPALQSVVPLPCFMIQTVIQGKVESILRNIFSVSKIELFPKSLGSSTFYRGRIGQGPAFVSTRDFQ